MNNVLLTAKETEQGFLGCMCFLGRYQIKLSPLSHMTYAVEVHLFKYFEPLRFIHCFSQLRIEITSSTGYFPIEVLPNVNFGGEF